MCSWQVCRLCRTQRVQTVRRRHFLRSIRWTRQMQGLPFWFRRCVGLFSVHSLHTRQIHRLRGWDLCGLSCGELLLADRCYQLCTLHQRQARDQRRIVDLRSVRCGQVPGFSRSKSSLQRLCSRPLVGRGMYTPRAMLDRAQHKT